MMSIMATIALLKASESSSAAEIRLWFGGDVNLGNAKNPILKPLEDILKGAVGIVNLEGPATEKSASGKKLKLRNAPEALAQLRQAGVQVAGIANNHALDAGANGPQETVQALQHAGIVPSGGPAGPAVFSVEGLRIVVAAYDLSGGVPPKLEKDLDAARPLGDLLIASFHVDGPPSYLPRPELRSAVKIALEEGAKIVVAHGTHAIGPVEHRNDLVVALGLGNLVFDCDCTNEREGLLLEVTLRGAKVDSASVIPVEAGLRGEPARLSSDPNGVFDLLEGIGSVKLLRKGQRASF
jgi:poly-gamma-glutamate capsule biosynthesis protein CapA/YwtB (metallophosphatase superfamily)